ncbi:hypothetical protein HYDPIDRAFT_118800 [Hydnomerulius pinastri MD-312]|uniref:NADH:ubiquinone reductase (non-electrogenic) n=1 Tax=Hydnomerulius pinastri MD-312 TaxID=994086 RepID=A0A0C9W8Y4_9AGAM|nr:hypothetical protein HYDPIDRAFT_118800 [Hydnomerulius pinastri MD-312]
MKPLHTRNPSALEATRKSQRPQEDLTNWYPELHPYMRVTLVEALPSVPPMFHKQLMQYTERTFKENRDDDWDHGERRDVLLGAPQAQDAREEEVDCGLVVWAAGNMLRKLTRDLMGGVGEQENRRGLIIDDHLRILGGPLYLRNERLHLDFVRTHRPGCVPTRCIPRADAPSGRSFRLDAADAFSAYQLSPSFSSESPIHLSPLYSIVSRESFSRPSPPRSAR